MTIGRRLLVLLAVPLAALLAFGLLARIQLSKIDESVRFAGESNPVGAATAQTRRHLLAAEAAAVLLTGLLGFLAFRRIVYPIQALERSVRTVAAGDYSRSVPFTEGADETGGLARSIEVLKQGAAAMDGQRWVKSSASAVIGELQGASSLEEFADRCLSGLVPLLRGGVAGFYVFEEETGQLRRTGSYGLSSEVHSAAAFGLGEGLVGQCARERKPLTLARLPSDYLRIVSGLGRPRLCKSWRRRSCPRTPCWASSKQPRFIRSTPVRTRCSPN